MFSKQLQRYWAFPSDLERYRSKPNYYKGNQNCGFNIQKSLDASNLDVSVSNFLKKITSIISTQPSWQPMVQMNPFSFSSNRSTSFSINKFCTCSSKGSPTSSLYATDIQHAPTDNDQSCANNF